MQTLARTLAEYDLEMLKVIAARWDVDLNTRDVKQAAQKLATAMLQSEKAEAVWGRLDDDQRGAMQMVLASNGGKMLSPIFTRTFGEIHRVGPDKLVQEKPYLSPTATIAEALYYRGLIATTVAQGSSTPTAAFIYVPTDLIPVLPAHQTGYKQVAEQAPAKALETMPQPENIRAADTAVVDDLTTFLAYCQLVDLTVENGAIPADHLKTIKPYFIGSNSPARMALIVALAKDMGIGAVSENFFRPVGNLARKWLDVPRPEQVRLLAETWRISTSYNELAFTPGLKLEQTGGWKNDPLSARQSVLNYLEMVPADTWWQVDQLISAVKEDEPDFQRPNGDYDSWYIRDAQSNQFLKGFESWDKVDGAMLRFILIGPMNGLGLLDTAQNGTVCRLTAYGRAFCGFADWPKVTNEATSITIQPDGLCQVPRSYSRYERFQLSRFSQWIKGGDPFEYRIGPDGLAQAAVQNIQAAQILTFLKRASGDKIPESVSKMVELWGQGGTQAATLSKLIVLRVPSEEMMNTLTTTPALRRFLGAPLGPMAVAVRADKWQELISALQSTGVMVEVDVEEAG